MNCLPRQNNWAPVRPENNCRSFATQRQQCFWRPCKRTTEKQGKDSKEFFDQAQRIQSTTEDPALRNLLHDTLATRDQITADLAKGDAAALSEIQALVSKIEQTAKH